jgi:hypothetical protein
LERNIFGVRRAAGAGAVRTGYRCSHAAPTSTARSVPMTPWILVTIVAVALLLLAASRRSPSPPPCFC